MIINGKQYRDYEAEEMQNELLARMRKEFIAQYRCDSRAILMFVMSIESGRFDDCQKDILRRKVSIADAHTILSNAVSHKVVSSQYVGVLTDRWGINNKEKNK